MGIQASYLGSQTIDSTLAIIGLGSQDVRSSFRRFEENVLLPCLTSHDLHGVFGLPRTRAQRLINTLSGEGAEAVSAFELFSIVLFTGDIPLYERTRKLLFLYGKQRELCTDDRKSIKGHCEVSRPSAPLSLSSPEDGDQDAVLDGQESAAMVRTLLRALSKATGGSLSDPEEIEADTATILSHVINGTGTDEVEVRLIRKVRPGKNRDRSGPESLRSHCSRLDIGCHASPVASHPVMRPKPPHKP